jgi:hypothetical protein
LANTFSKEERVAFEDMVAGFDDALVMSRNVSKYITDPTMMERTSNTIWRPVPYIAQSVDGPAGTDITSLFTDVGQLSVPSSFGYSKAVPWMMNAAELRDALQSKRYGIAAAQKLASDVNVSVATVVGAQATLCVIKTTAAAGFADVANIDKLMNESGIPMSDRYLALSSGDYNLLAADLAGRQNIGDAMASEAYKQAYVGRLAGFETYKLDYAGNQAAKASGVAAHVDGAANRYVPISSTAGVNIDNRQMTLPIHVTAGTVQVGDFFTIANVYNIHPITKVSTGVLKTFRIMSLTTGSGGSGNIKISPAIISADSTPTDIEQQYQNVDSLPADSATITILNTTAAKRNLFWYKDCIELMPGKESIDNGGGVDVIQSSTPQGLVLQLSKQWSLVSNKMLYRLDCRWGVVVTNPEMCGIALFGQT